MPRSAADATRFTATGPYVGPKAPYKLPDFGKPKQNPHSSPESSNTSSTTKTQGQPGQPGSGSGTETETPRQKVERLRAQARAARLAQSTSTIDRLIERGRRAANGAHKVIIYTLIAASGVCGALTLYSAVSLTMWNRRQRELWLDRQLQTLQDAREAYVAGTATPEQLELLRNEKIGEIEKQKLKEAKEQRLWNRAKRFLFEGMKGADAASTTSSSSPSTVQEGKIGVLDALNAKQSADETAAAAAATPETTQKPGSLDVLAANAETAAKQSARGWSSWIWGR